MAKMFDESIYSDVRNQIKNASNSAIEPMIRKINPTVGSSAGAWSDSGYVPGKGQSGARVISMGFEPATTPASTPAATPVSTPRVQTPTPTPPTATVYPKNGGAPYTGYIINGLTYKDPYGKVRIDSGSTVNTAGGTYYYDSDFGGVPTMQTSRNMFTQMYDEAKGMYGEGTRAQQEAIDAAIKSAEREYELRRSQIRDNYGRANEEAEAAYIKASNPYGPIGQRLESLGLGDSGYAETTYARLGNEYQKQINENNRAMEMAIAELDLAEAQARDKGNIQKANMLAQEKQQIAAMIMQMGGTLYSADIATLGTAVTNQQNKENTQFNREWMEREYADAKAAEENEKAIYRFKGGIFDQGVADALGVSVDQLPMMHRNTFPELYKTSSSSGSKSSNKNNKKGTLTGSSLLQHFNSLSDELSDDEKYKLLAKQGYFGSEVEAKAAVLAAQAGYKKPEAPETQSEDLKVDMKSVLLLGRGRLDAQSLEKLIQQGLVEEYVEDGYLKYRNVSGLPTILK